jgi:haloalkane dehalogenase
MTIPISGKIQEHPQGHGGSAHSRRVTSQDVVNEHRAAGRRFEATGVGSFVREEGPATGEPVVCLHGVPASSFLYRKVLRELAARGLRGVAFDLPGLGLADRPAAFDYTWTGLGRFCAAAVDALGLGRFHLVVHDLGGPVGFELAAAMPGRIASLTVLNTLVEVDKFKRPWSMEPFARRGFGEIYIRALTKPAFRLLMRLQGVQDPTAIPRPEVDAYLDLLRLGDGGHAFLKIMRGFERTRAKRDLYVRVLGDGRYPVQVVWSANDPVFKLAVAGEAARRAAGAATIHTVPAKHFLQEDQAPAVAEHIARLVTDATQNHQSAR